MSLRDLIQQAAAVAECRRIAVDNKAASCQRVKELYEELVKHDAQATTAATAIEQSDKLLAELNAKIAAASRSIANPRALFDRLWSKELTLKVDNAEVMRRYNEVRSRITRAIGAQTIILVDQASNLDEVRHQVAATNHRLWSDYLKESWTCVSRPGLTIDELLNL